MKKAAGRIGIIIIVVLMAAAAFTFAAPHFGWSVDVVYSGSMEPDLKVGSVVVTRPVEAEEIKVEDIITFYSPLTENLTSHRVVAVEEGSPLHLITKGDANEDADPFIVPSENVVGVICFHLPYFGYAARFIKTQLGLLLTLCLPGLIIIGIEVRNIWQCLVRKKLRENTR